MPDADSSTERGVLAIDVGNSRVKLGWFPPAGECPSEKPAAAAGLEIARPALASPAEMTAVKHRGRPAAEWLSEVNQWCDDVIDAHLWRGVIATVHPAVAEALESAFTRRGGNHVRRIEHQDLPLEVAVKRPGRVGIDRLLNALAAKRLAPAGHGAVVIDMGTAVTVDLLDATGAFAGGAILPGPGLSAGALHAGTAALPKLLESDGSEAPAALGKSTETAIASGVYWGVVGATRELCRRLAAECPQADQAIVTGGAAAVFAEHLADDPLPLRHVPYLTLAGLHLAAEAQAS